MLFFIRSRQNFLKTVSYLRYTNIYLSLFGPNDGLLLINDQKLEDLGTDLGVLSGIDHADLVHSYPYSSTVEKIRIAFTRALMKYLFANE